MTTAHRFSQYVLRKAGEEDLELAAAWTAADPDHAGMDPRFWIQQGYRMESWVLSDEHGPVFFFKGLVFENQAGKHVERVLEVHVQFSPEAAKRRLAMALVEGLRWLERNVPDLAEVRFESRNAKLIGFCETRLGFVHQNGKLSKRLNAGEFWPGHREETAMDGAQTLN